MVSQMAPREAELLFLRLIDVTATLSSLGFLAIGHGLSERPHVTGAYLDPFPSGPRQPPEVLDSWWEWEGASHPLVPAPTTAGFLISSRLQSFPIVSKIAFRQPPSHPGCQRIRRKEKSGTICITRSNFFRGVEEGCQGKGYQTPEPVPLAWAPIGMTGSMPPPSQTEGKGAKAGIPPHPIGPSSPAKRYILSTY